MGSGRWSADDWATYSRSTVDKSTSEIYKSSSLNNELNPKDILVRESRDSVDNPNSTAIIVGLDVTGSMGMIADSIARDGLGTLFEEILNRKPVSDPHLMFMALGDAAYDRHPLQVSQFEADARIIEQLTNIYLERGGGWNSTESYDLPWYFAATHTAIDCLEKRNKKGYLFTFGDEEAPLGLTTAQIKNIIGDDLQDNLNSKDILEMAQRMYHVFHIVIEEGSHARTRLDSVLNSWNNLIGQNVIRLSDYTKLSEVIVSTIQVIEGLNKEEVVNSWSGSTAVVVRKAIDSLVVTENKSNSIVRF